MLTNPSTLGLFDENIIEIARVVHEAGGLLYYDGANANAILGKSRPGDMGFDIVHFNMHKTFGTAGRRGRAGGRPHHRPRHAGAFPSQAHGAEG
jgi:glycine dehydrogenase subunit 2